MAGAGPGWDSQRPLNISSRLQRPHCLAILATSPTQHSCAWDTESQVLLQPTSSLPTFLIYLCDNVYQALEPKDIASILALMYHTVLAIQPTGGVCKVNHAHVH